MGMMSWPCARSQSQLAWGAFFFCGDFFHAPYQCQVLMKIFSLEARRISPVVVWTKIFKSFDFSGQEAAAQWGIGDERDAKFLGCGQDLVFGVAGPQRILGLQRGDGVHLVGAANGLRGSFG